jgi:hypothetical protein
MPVGGGLPVEGRCGQRVWEGEYGVTYCVHMNVNGKMRPGETILGMGGGGKKENSRGGKLNYVIL